MSEFIMTLNQFIARVAEYKLMAYIEDIYTEQEVREYLAGDFEVHLYYLIETWTNYIDDQNLIDVFKIHYNSTGSFNHLWDYFVDGCCPEFDDEWLYDIFERHILVANLCLK